MEYTRISADCHLDLPWMPRDLFTANASAAMRERMPFVAEGPDGPYWTAKNGTSFGLVNGVGPSGQKYVPGQHHDPLPKHAGLSPAEQARIVTDYYVEQGWDPATGEPTAETLRALEIEEDAAHATARTSPTLNPEERTP